MTGFTIGVLCIAFGILGLNLAFGRKRNRQASINFPSSSDQESSHSEEHQKIAVG
jgi:hypothetical protein